MPTIPTIDGLPECKYLLAWVDVKDWEAGLILFSLSFIVVIVSLALIVKLLGSLLKGEVHALTRQRLLSGLANETVHFVNNT